MTQMRHLMQPLAAVTPPRHMAHLVASRSYLSYRKDELLDKLKHNPYSYIQVINPDASGEVEVPRGTTPFFREVRKGYDAFKDRGWLQDAPGEEWIVYRQSKEEHSWTGVVCNLDLNLCAAGGLKTHEQTLAHREVLFASFLDEVGFHAEPILCARPDGNSDARKAQTVLDEITARTPHTDFMTADGIRHEIWRTSTHSETGREFAAAWQGCDTLYLADGHHRLASSQRLAEAHPDLTGAQHILAFVVPESQLTILGFHKEVSEIDMSPETWQSALENLPHGEVERLEDPNGTPSRPGEIVIHHNRQVWRISRQPSCPLPTDADYVQQHLLSGTLGIKDPRDDKRLRHLPEPQRPEGDWASRAHAHPDRVLILMHPLPFGHIRAVADQNGTLPPKSTWVEPKIRSALFIHQFRP
ncbi:MAG: DUF1015 family protein [Bacteroidota bacterium]|nr:DUF1015 family protein [Bacteroidota bacterium]